MFFRKKIKNVGNIYRIKLAVHNLHARLGSIFCVTHAEITGICGTLLLLLRCKWRQGGAADDEELCIAMKTARGRRGSVTNRYTYEKERKRQTEGRDDGEYL